MFQFPGCPPMALFCSDHGDGALPPPGFPIRISMDQSPACGSPWLNAACHVLRRQSVPWHSPCALICLIFRRTPPPGPVPLRSRPGPRCRSVCPPLSLFSCSLCFPCAVFKMRMKTVEADLRDSSKRYSLREIPACAGSVRSFASGLRLPPDVFASFFCRSSSLGLRLAFPNDRPGI